MIMQCLSHEIMMPDLRNEETTMGDEPLDEVGLHYQVFHCHSLEEHQVLIIHDDGDLN